MAIVDGFIFLGVVVVMVDGGVVAFSANFSFVCIDILNYPFAWGCCECVCYLFSFHLHYCHEDVCLAVVDVAASVDQCASVG